MVSAASEADVTVSFYAFTGAPGQTLGRTNYRFYDGSETLHSATVQLGITGDARNDGITATHEFGHALGLIGHSPHPGDLMFNQGNDTDCGCLTSRDVNTLLTAYCGQFGSSATARTAPHRGTLRYGSIE